MKADERSEDEKSELDSVVQGQPKEEGDDDAQRGRVAFVAACYTGGGRGEGTLMGVAAIVGAVDEDVV